MELSFDLQQFLEKILDRPISYHRIFAKLTGDVQAGVFLSQAYYWSSRGSDPEGWFYKIQSEWEEETCLTRKQQENARKRLLQFDFWEEKKQDIPAKLYYRLNRPKLYQAIWAFLNVRNGQTVDSKALPQIVPNGHTGLSQTDMQACPKRTFHDSSIEYYSQTTPESSSLRERIPLDIPSLARTAQPTSQLSISDLAPGVAIEPQGEASVPNENTSSLSVRDCGDNHAGEMSLFAPEMPVSDSKTTLGYRDTFSGDSVQPCPVSARKRAPVKSASRKKPAQTETDSRATHPAIVAFRDIVLKFPKKPVWDQIIAIIGDRPDRLKLEKCYVEAMMRGPWCSNGYKWVEWYRDGIPEYGVKPKKQKEVSKYGPVSFKEFAR